jgi:ATP-dependent RNA helicase SUPV3L1/SUV3
VSRLLDFFRTRVLAGDPDLRIADLGAQIEVALALELADGFLALPLRVRATYSRAPVNVRGRGVDVLAGWGGEHARAGRVLGTELTTLYGRDRLLLDEDRSRLATLYLWLAQRFPEVYVNEAAVADLRDEADDGIEQALRMRGTRARLPSTQAPKRAALVGRRPRSPYPKSRRRG